jgi:hypothetical protein
MHISHSPTCKKKSSKDHKSKTSQVFHCIFAFLDFEINHVVQLGGAVGVIQCV